MTWSCPKVEFCRAGKFAPSEKNVQYIPFPSCPRSTGLPAPARISKSVNMELFDIITAYDGSWHDHHLRKLSSLGAMITFLFTDIPR